MRFLCDDNLGKLAKYLRILGFDTLFFTEITDPELLRLAASGERFLLTRNRNLSTKKNPYGIFIITFNNPLDQLRQVINSLNLQINLDNLFDRCSRCNDLCITVDKSQIKGEVFPYILKIHEIFKQCPNCKRYYWKGSHYKNIINSFKRTLDNKYFLGEWPELE